jgi:tRNA-modifying protein YgfZ
MTGMGDGGAFADLSSWIKVEVSGADAGGWLQDLVSADIDGLEDGRAKGSLLLSPTGKIQAVFTVARRGEAWLLLQEEEQSRRVDELLAPYVLSSDVTIRDRTGELVLLAVPGASPPFPSEISQPSCLGWTGFDVLGDRANEGNLRRAVEGLVRAAEEDIEAWRIRRGLPRLGVDVLPDDLPQEAGLDDLVAVDKGCYLGQEAVARVRNLGHPRRLVMHLVADGPVEAGDEVVVSGEGVGPVTSVAGPDALARIGWDGREGPFETSSGAAMTPVQASSPV